MRWSKLLPLAAAAALVACGPQQLTRQQRAVEEQLIKGQVDLWERAMNSLKPDSLAPLYEHSPDFTAAWPDGRRTHGWEEEQQAQKDFAARTKSFNFDVQEPTTEVMTPTIALTTFRHATDVTDSLTGRALYSGQGTMVWVKDPTDKIWRIHALQISRNPEKPAQPGRRR